MDKAAGRVAVKRIAFELDLTRHWNRRVMSGIVRYANECGTWQLFTNEPVGLSVLRRDDPQGFHGAIVPAYTPSPWPEEVPSVYVGTTLQEVYGPTFSTDNERVSQLAAEHLMGIGFPRVAFIGITGTTFSHERGRHFTDAVERAHGTCLRFDLPSRSLTTYMDYLDGLVQWLEHLPLPCAVLAADDELAALVITAGRERGLRMPNELAVLGINNDDLWCSSVVPSLSSVVIAADELGWQAARHLDRVIAGELPYVRQMHSFSPTGIVARQSTEVIGYDNPVVSEAVRLIRLRAPRESVTVEQIAQDLSVSRQYLSQSFQKYVGHSVKQEIDRVRINLIRETLATGASSPKQLAHQMGFSDLSQFSRFCRRLLGQSPRSVPRQDVPTVGSGE